MTILKLATSKFSNFNNIVSKLLVNTEQMKLFSRLALTKPIPLKILVSDKKFFNLTM